MIKGKRFFTTTCHLSKTALIFYLKKTNVYPVRYNVCDVFHKFTQNITTNQYCVTNLYLPFIN